MQKLLNKKILLLSLFMVGILGVTASADTIGGVIYTSYYVQADGDETVYKTTPTGGRVRSEVGSFWNTNGKKVIDFEKRTPPWMPNKILHQFYGPCQLSPISYGHSQGDQFRLYNSYGYTRYDGFLHL